MNVLMSITRGGCSSSLLQEFWSELSQAGRSSIIVAFKYTRSLQYVKQRVSVSFQAVNILAALGPWSAKACPTAAHTSNEFVLGLSGDCSVPHKAVVGIAVDRYDHRPQPASVLFNSGSEPRGNGYSRSNS